MPDEPGELSEAVARVEDAFGGHLGPLDYEDGLDPDANDAAVMIFEVVLQWLLRG